MNLVEHANAAAIVKRKEIAEASIALDDRAIFDLSKQFPYFGYVEVTVADIAQVLMFSNNDDLVARKCFWLGADSYERTSLQIWAALSKRSSVTFDVGSYTGIYSLVAARANPAGKVLAFEALDRVYFRLMINKIANRLANLTIYNNAVSDRQGLFDFNVYSGESIMVTGSSLIEKVSDRKVFEKKSVKTLALDSIIEGNSELGRVGLIKIDAEGAEHLVLRGASKLIERDAPDILVELLQSADIPAVSHAIRFHAYNFYQIDDVQGVIEKASELKVATGMHNLNTLISCKTEDEVRKLLTT